MIIERLQLRSKGQRRVKTLTTVKKKQHYQHYVIANLNDKIVSCVQPHNFISV